MKNIIKKLNIVDIVIIIGVMIALFVGVCTMKHFRQTADKQIEATSPINFQVYLRGVTVTSPDFPIKEADKTFITIRNVPYTELSVLNVFSQSRMKAVASSKSISSYIVIKDPAQPSMYDAVVTISDVAKITKDGAVVGGNKIKIGLPVTLEGANYKFHGTISDVRVKNDASIEDDGINNSVG